MDLLSRVHSVRTAAPTPSADQEITEALPQQPSKEQPAGGRPAESTPAATPPAESQPSQPLPSETLPSQTFPSQGQPGQGQQDGTAYGGQDQLTTQTALPPQTPADSGIPLFCAGVLTALLAAALLAALRRWLRRSRAGRPLRVQTACVHGLGARDSQQDAFGLVGPETTGGQVLAVVADGMGGLVNSGQMSEANAAAMTDGYAPGEDCPPARQLQLLLKQALLRVDRLLEGSPVKSGSTLAACLIQADGLSWLSVGDSRIYLWRGGGLIQLSEDHDFSHDLTLMALQDEMTWDQADSDIRRERLTSYIGGGFPRKVAWNPIPVALRPGDRVLLVSDGVYRALSQAELAAMLALPARRCAQAVCAAIEEKRLPQQDNYTALILELN